MSPETSAPAAVPDHLSGVAAGLSGGLLPGGHGARLCLARQSRGAFDAAFLQALPNRLYGIMTNETLIAVPLFVFMGVMLERSRVAENLLDTMTSLFGPLRGGLGISVTLVGMLLAASTGIVGATVVTMGLLSLPTMLRRNYDPGVSSGIICAAGTLGQIIPPSIILVLLGDVLSASYQQAQLNQGIYSPETVSVGDLFVGAIVPGPAAGAALSGLYGGAGPVQTRVGAGDPAGRAAAGKRPAVCGFMKV